MTFENELNKNDYILNLEIKIGEYTFLRFLPDLNYTPDDKTYVLLSDVSINPSTIDVTQVKTTLTSINFTLLDKNGEISSILGVVENSLLGNEVILKQGFINNEFSYNDYKEISRGVLRSVNKVDNNYKFIARELTSRLSENIFQKSNELNEELLENDSIIILKDSSIFPQSGIVKIDDEFIYYDNNDQVQTLSTLTRGFLGSTVSSKHENDLPVFKVDVIEENPINILLQMSLSGGNEGSSFDVLNEGLGLSENIFNMTEIIELRDKSFSSDVYRFELWDLGNALKFFEKEILEATNTRFINKDGKISIVELDQIKAGEVFPEINENTIIGQPSWDKSADRIYNEIIINYNYSASQNKFTRIETLIDQESIDTYLQKRTISFSFKGIKSDLNGLQIVKTRAKKLLERLATPQTRVSVKTFFKNSIYNIGEILNIVHRNIPQSGGGLGFNSSMEVLSKGVDYTSATVKFNLQFTSSFNHRFALIAPSPLIYNILDRKTFDVPRPECYAVGYVVQIKNEIKTIEKIEGNKITLASEFSFDLTENDRLKFTDYDLTSDAQKARYIFISPTDQNFPSGEKYYSIIF